MFFFTIFCCAPAVSLSGCFVFFKQRSIPPEAGHAVVGEANPVKRFFNSERVADFVMYFGMMCLAVTLVVVAVLLLLEVTG